MNTDSGQKTAHSTHSVLVVDDEPELRELLVDALSVPGLHVAAVGSGREAVELAQRSAPDFVVADLQLSDCTGLDVIDRVRALAGDVPAVVITGHRDPDWLSRASQRRPVEMMIKPLDVDRLRETIEREIDRREHFERNHRRTQRLRRLARNANQQRKTAQRELETTCADLSSAYRSLSGQVVLQNAVLSYQQELLSAKNDDDVFRAMFRTWVHRCGPVFGVSMVCNDEAKLRIAGRFGVPHPDGIRFCEHLAQPIIDTVLTTPDIAPIDAGEIAETFDGCIRKYLVGLTVLPVPLLPSPGEMIGLVVLYRKGEQPFTDADLSLAEVLSHPTAVALRRND
ncbi:MAG: response regulator [Phycisphaerae bacterium]